PLRALPPAPGPDRPCSPQLPQPARLLALVRRGLRRLLAARNLARRARTAAVGRRRALAGCGARRPRRPRRPRLARRARAPAATPRGAAGGGARGPCRRPPRARRRGASRRRDEPLRARLHPALAAHLALAAAGAREPDLDPDGRARARLLRAGPPHL